MSEMEIPQTTLRETLTDAFEQSEAGTLPTAEERARDEAGRFAPKVEAKVEPKVEVKEVPQGPQRPTTWKKDYLPIWDKIAAGDTKSLTADELKKLAEYTTQRENEYKTGVSTYRTEAQNARELQEAITPYAQDLQANGLTPATWIKQVGQVHTVLVRGSPEQKLGVFTQLARQYGVPLQAIQAYQQNSQVPPILAQIMQPMGDMRGQIQQLLSWKQQREQNDLQQEATQLEGEVKKMAEDVTKYPHFEAVREDMAQLLENLAARDLPSAYKMAVRMNDDLYQQEVDRLAAGKQGSKTTAVQKARAQTISPKSATPSGSVTTVGAKDRRSVLSEGFDALAGGRV